MNDTPAPGRLTNASVMLTDAKVSAIRRARDRLDISQAQLAKDAGTTQQTVDRIERGQLSHSMALPAILAVLGISEDGRQLTGSGMLASAPPLGGFVKSDARSSAPKMPVFMMWAGASADAMQTRVAGMHIIRPDPLFEIEEAYGLMVADNDMYPAYKLSDILLIHPHLNPRPGNDIIMSKPGDNDFGATRIRTLLEWQREKWLVRRYNPEQDEEINVAAWPIRHVIVGKLSMP